MTREFEPTIKKIIVKENEIDIETDLEDGWFSIIDRHNDWYDDMGAVIFCLFDLQELIDGLKRLKEEREFWLKSEGGYFDWDNVG